MTRKRIRHRYGDWTIWCSGTRSVWEARHRQTKEYVNFSEEQDTTLVNLKRILDSPELRKEQHERCMTKLKFLETSINELFAKKQEAKRAAKVERLRRGVKADILNRRIARLKKRSNN